MSNSFSVTKNAVWFVGMRCFVHRWYLRYTSPLVHPASATTFSKLFCCSYPVETSIGPTLGGGARRGEKLVAVEQRCKQRRVMVEQNWVSCVKMSVWKAKTCWMKQEVVLKEWEGKREDQQIESAQISPSKSFCSLTQIQANFTLQLSLTFTHSPNTSALPVCQRPFGSKRSFPNTFQILVHLLRSVFGQRPD